MMPPPGGFGPPGYGPGGGPPGGFGPPSGPQPRPIFALPSEWFSALMDRLADLSTNRIAKCVGEGSVLDTNDNQIGNIVTLGVGDTADRTIIQSGGASQNSQVVTLDIQGSFDVAAIPDEIEIPDVWGLVRGKLGFGVGAARFEALFDVRNGVQLSFLAASYTVSVALIEPNSPNIIAPIQVAAGVSWQVRPARSEPTFTFPRVILIAPATPAVFLRIPAFARTVYVFVSPADGPFTLEFFGGATIGSRRFFEGTSMAEPLVSHLATEGIRIPGGANFIRLSTASDTAVSLTAMFGLNL